MRLKSKSAESWTRARPGPTTEDTIESNWSRSLRSKPVCRSSELPSSPLASPDAPSASSRPVSSTIETRSGLSPLTAEATRWRIARTCWLSRLPRTLSTIEAEGSTLSRENSGRSGSTRWTRALLDAVERPDGARELAFERAQVVDVLDEAGGAERVRLVEDLVADAAALGQPALGELHAGAQDLVLRHQDRRAVLLDLVGDALALQVLHDGRRILHRQVGEQRRHLRRRDAQDQEGEEADERDRDGGHGREPRRTQRPDELDETLHRTQAPRSRHATTRQELPGVWFPSG